MSTADPMKTFAPNGEFYGDNGLPAWATASEGLDIGPDDWAKMQGQKAIQKSAQAAAVTPPPVAEAAASPVPDQSPPININVNVDGGRTGGAGSGGLGGTSTAPTARPVLPPPVLPPPPPVQAPPQAAPVAPVRAPAPLGPSGPADHSKPEMTPAPRAPVSGPYGMFKPPGTSLRTPQWMRAAPMAGGR